MKEMRVMKVIEKPSPNQSERLLGSVTNVIVLHTTEGDAKGALSWLTNPESKVSAHFLVTRDGTIYKLVPTTRKAWHAGKSRLGVCNQVNNISIGIEIESYEGARDYPDKQLEALAWLIWQIMKNNPTPISTITTHKDISIAGKQDPVDFPYLRFWKIFAKVVCREEGIK
jgi:N-acetylmuramoyl-L-alanine amidase